MIKVTLEGSGSNIDGLAKVLESVFSNFSLDPVVLMNDAGEVVSTIDEEMLTEEEFESLNNETFALIKHPLVHSIEINVSPNVV